MNRKVIISKINNTLKYAYIFYNIGSVTLLIMEFSVMLYFKATLKKLFYNVKIQNYAHRTYGFGTALSKYLINKKNSSYN